MQVEDIEREKLEIEREKLDLDRRRTEIEVNKANWAAAAVLIPIFALLLTIVYGIYSANEQNKSQFQLEVAKSVFQSEGEYAAAVKLNFYKRMFSDRITEDFGVIPKGDLWDPVAVNSQKEFVRIVAERGLAPAQVLALWTIMFPGDDWAKNPALVSAVQAIPTRKCDEPR